MTVLVFEKENKKYTKRQLRIEFRDNISLNNDFLSYRPHGKFLMILFSFI